MATETLTQERILEAAEEVLRRYGPAKANVVDVARALGVSHASVYRHFGSKAALRDAVTERWLESISTPLAAIASEEGPAPERLRRWLDGLVHAKRRKALEDPELFATYVELYHRALRQLGSEPLPVGVHSPGHIAETDEQARQELWEPYRGMRNRIGAERGWGPTSRAAFEREAAEGSLYVGSPETVARKIAVTVRGLGVSRFDLKYSAGTLRHELMLKSIELYGREVIPQVRQLLGERVALTAGA